MAAALTTDSGGAVDASAVSILSVTRVAAGAASTLRMRRLQAQGSTGTGTSEVVVEYEVTFGSK